MHAEIWEKPADPFPLPADLAPLTGAVGHEEELPEFARMRGLGWHFIDCDGAGYAAFAAVWRPSARAWLPDRRVPVWQVHRADGRVEHRVATGAERIEVATDLSNALATRGLPPPPPGRMWFVRLPPGWSVLGDYLEDLYRRIDEQKLDEFAGATWLEFVHDQIRRDFVDRPC